MSKTLPEINVSVTFRHTESTPALKSYATEKVTHCLRKYINNSADVQIVLSVQKRDHVVEVVLRTKGFDITAKEITEDLYSAIDKVVDNLDKQMRKRKERMQDHKHQVAPQA
ncbi:MAG: ribosome-associated translation inhibitor RaiA [Bdellovibrionales bacterium]|nr:ribosome-associated translation inhibitor RaiA [Bdellovibrionales bacterium]